jgi:hypothetical protein
MNSIREKAIKLRLTGRSYNEINKLLDIPKSTLSGWLSNVVLSKKAISRIESRVALGVLNGFVKRNKLQTSLAKERAEKIRSESFKEIKKLSKTDLLLFGAAVYWAEGYKRPKIVGGKVRTHHSISLTNSDPEMITAFITFLTEIMSIPRDKIALNLRLYPHMESQKEIGYWSRITGLNKSQFDRPSFVVSKSSLGIRPYNRLPHGTIQVRVANTKEFYRLMGWIDGMKSSLAQFQRKV